MFVAAIRVVDQSRRVNDDCATRRVVVEEGEGELGVFKMSFGDRSPDSLEDLDGPFLIPFPIPCQSRRIRLGIKDTLGQWPATQGDYHSWMKDFDGRSL